MQSFLDWYAPLAARAGGTPAFLSALEQRPGVFSPVLAQALKLDVKDRGEPGGRLLGGGFDPFLAARNPCSSYVAGSVSGGGGFDDVEIWGMCAGKRQDHPDAIAEVERRDGAWVFANFQYPDGGGDLLTLLHALAQ